MFRACPFWIHWPICHPSRFSDRLLHVSQTGSAVKLSIVTSLYKSQAFLPEFHARLTKVATALVGDDYEIIMVNDGSPDQSLDLAVALAQDDPHLIVLDLSRNFGHHPAFWAGMHHAKGDLTFLIDSDLDVAPETLADFMQELQRTQADVVYGVQAQRQGPAGSRLAGGLFWRIFSSVSDVDVPADIMTERLLTRPYLDALLQMQDRNLFLAGMYHWPGFRQVPLALTKTPRKTPTAYTVFHRVKLLVEAISSFSSMPLQVIFWFGFFIFLVSTAYSTLLLARKLILPESVADGFTFIALALMLGTGMIMMSLGVVGLYLHRIFRQVQGRPVFVVRRIYKTSLKE